MGKSELVKSFDTHYKSKDQNRPSKDSSCERNFSEKLKECTYGAVVTVASQFVLVGAGVTGVTGGTELAPNVRTDQTLEGNGFFVEICDELYVLTASSLVLMPPSLTSVVNRYPFVDPSNLALGVMKSQMVKASRIFVEVNNVNRQHCAGRYEAQLVGVDGAGNIAVLRISPCQSRGIKPPCPNTHPHLKLGDNCSQAVGDKIWALVQGVGCKCGDARSSFGVELGNVSNKHYYDPNGWVLNESVLFSGLNGNLTTGYPIVNCKKEVVAMQVSTIETDPNDSDNDCGILGVSSGVLRHVAYTIVKGAKDQRCTERKNLEIVEDSLGCYWRYVKSYLGLSYQTLNLSDVNTTFNYTSGTATVHEPKICIDDVGTLVRTETETYNGGIRVVGVAGLNPLATSDVANGYYYVPGGTGTEFLYEYVPPSTLLGLVSPGDIIHSINGKKLGSAECERGPGGVTWSLCPGNVAELVYSKANACDENCKLVRCTPINTCLKKYPIELDYPWYAVDCFPRLDTLPNPGFTYPAGQNLLGLPTREYLTQGSISFLPAV